jgi:hypothetical protein
MMANTAASSHSRAADFFTVGLVGSIFEKKGMFMQNIFSLRFHSINLIISK